MSVSPRVRGCFLNPIFVRSVSAVGIKVFRGMENKDEEGREVKREGEKEKKGKKNNWKQSMNVEESIHIREHS